MSLTLQTLSWCPTSFKIVLICLLDSQSILSIPPHFNCVFSTFLITFLLCVFPTHLTVILRLIPQLVLADFNKFHIPFTCVSMCTHYMYIYKPSEGPCTGLCKCIRQTIESTSAFISKAISNYSWWGEKVFPVLEQKNVAWESTNLITSFITNIWNGISFCKNFWIISF